MSWEAREESEVWSAGSGFLYFNLGMRVDPGAGADAGVSGEWAAKVILGAMGQRVTAVISRSGGRLWFSSGMGGHVDWRLIGTSSV